MMAPYLISYILILNLQVDNSNTNDNSNNNCYHNNTNRINKSNVANIKHRNKLKQITENDEQ